MSFFSSTFFQPIEFQQLEHEKRFKFTVILILILITVFVVSLFVVAQIIEPGALFKKLNFLTGEPVDRVEVDDVTKLCAIFILFPAGVTALAMITSEICAWVKRPASTIVHPVCSAGFIVNSIPFFSLNTSIVLAMVVRVVAIVFFEFFVSFWLTHSVIITTIFATNKLARKHVATRLRQHIDTFTIGGNSTVHPVVTIVVLPIRSLIRDAQTPNTNANTNTNKAG